MYALRRPTAAHLCTLTSYQHYIVDFNVRVAPHAGIVEGLAPIYSRSAAHIVEIRVLLHSLIHFLH